MQNSLTLKQTFFFFLQVGLAVGDTEKIKKLATIKRLALQIDYHVEVEASYPGFITRPFYEEVYDYKPNKQPLHHRYVTRRVHILECAEALNLSNLKLSHFLTDCIGFDPQFIIINSPKPC